MQVNPRGGEKSNLMSAVVIDGSPVDTPVTLQRFQDLPERPISQEPHLAVKFVKEGIDFSMKKRQKQIDSHVLKLLGFAILERGEN